jgi:hypothetical protein
MSDDIDALKAEIERLKDELTEEREAKQMWMRPNFDGPRREPQAGRPYQTRRPRFLRG